MRIYVGFGSQQYLVCTFQTRPDHEILHREVQAQLVRNNLTRRFNLESSSVGKNSMLFYEDDEDGMKILISSDADLKDFFEQANKREQASSLDRPAKMILQLERGERLTSSVTW
jgi:hypothetical protein